jgi:NADH dehydrogenase/NADH:ubiquinone oxidoreductase subunit G
VPPRPVDFDPNMPLRREKHERYARLRAILTPKLQAAREAGFETMTPGNVAKLDRRKDVRARIAALCKMDEEIVRMKRERIEARLNLAAYGNILQFATIDEETGEITAIDWRKVAESDLAVIVSDLSFDAKTGRLTRFDRDNALNALSQLREMFGFKVNKVAAEFSGPGGRPIEVAQYTDAQRIQALSALIAKVKTVSRDEGQ